MELMGHRMYAEDQGDHELVADELLLAAGIEANTAELGLDRAGIDPAIAATVLLTTITDVVGFFVFLGLAALFLL